MDYRGNLLKGEGQILRLTDDYNSLYSVTVMTKKKQVAVLLRLTPEEQKLEAAIREKLGISASTEILRMGLKALAVKEGVSI